MNVAVLISGSLFRAPEERTSQAGRCFVSATLKVGGENCDAEFWSLMVFSESAQAELLRLGIGDALSAQGKLKLELYNGKISRTCFVDSVLPLRAPPKERKPKTPAPGSKAADQLVKRSLLLDAPALFDDDIPF